MFAIVCFAVGLAVGTLAFGEQFTRAQVYEDKPDMIFYGLMWLLTTIVIGGGLTLLIVLL